MEPVVVGLYGISGCGKSHILDMLAESRPEWRCLEGSAVLKQVVADRGLSFEEFQTLKNDALVTELRNEAIATIRNLPGMSIVAGHSSFPIVNEDDSNSVSFRDVVTDGDVDTFRYIFYLDTDANFSYLQRETDRASDVRQRPQLSVETLRKWSDHEKSTLSRICKQHGIHFEAVKTADELIEKVRQQALSSIVKETQMKSRNELHKAVRALPSSHTYLLIDGDGTLSADDTSTSFFEHEFVKSSILKNPLKTIFTRYNEYCFQGFFEAALLYSTVFSEELYKRVSDDIGRSVQLYQAWLDLLSNLPVDVHAVVVSSGNRDVWQTVLQTHKKLGSISLIAGNHLDLHSYLIDSEAKAFVALELRQKEGGCKVISFGDSSVDVPMLKASDRGYVVVDAKMNRSMASFIRSVALSSSEPHRTFSQLLLNEQLVDSLHDGIPFATISSIGEALSSGSLHAILNVESCGGSSASILATLTRRADLNGPELQKVHEDVGKFLADTLVDTFPMHMLRREQFQHVAQGTHFIGHVAAAKVLILPLMRGGEPMSRGIFDRFPSAALFHFWDDKKLSPQSKAVDELTDLLRGANEVILVDSVINEGHSMRRALDYLFRLVEGTSKRFYVLTAVVQRKAAESLPKEYPRVRFLTLRVSDNQYKGNGGTDTGNRLFGTTL